MKTKRVRFKQACESSHRVYDPMINDMAQMVGKWRENDEDELEESWANKLDALELIEIIEAE